MKNFIMNLNFNMDSLEVNKTYVTDFAIGYFREIRTTLDVIAQHITKQVCGNVGGPNGLVFYIGLSERVDKMEEFLETANKNNQKSAEKILDIRDILIKFETIKKLMLDPNENLREDGCQLFIRTANLYSDEETKEFVSLLDQQQMYNILGIINAEATLIEKKLTTTPLRQYISERIKTLEQSKIHSESSIDIESEI